MVSLSKFMCVCTLILLINPTFAQQSYDKSDCTSQPQVPGSNYLCNSRKRECDTYVVYRAKGDYQTLSSISSLFNTSLSSLLHANNMSQTSANNLTPGHEILIPVTCTCPDRFAQAIILYNASHLGSLERVACEFFEGLVKAQTLIEANPNFNEDVTNNSIIHVPIRCACPEASDLKNGTKFLVTYPVFPGDQTDLISRKFGVPEKMILDFNKLDPFEAIYPQTTLLVPTKGTPVLYLDVKSVPEDPNLSPRALIPFQEIVPGKKSSNKKLSLFLGVGFFSMVVLMVLACVIFVFVKRNNHPRKFESLSTTSLTPSNFLPDFLDGMSKLKHSLLSLTLEELKIATSDFSEASVIGGKVFRGRIGNLFVAIEQMNSDESAHRVMDILTRINHLNVVKLEGCCYGTNPHLVFEFANNGSLRDCLSNAKMAKQFTWEKRMQIAFDLAVGLHYIHHCTKPAYVHRNINSRNVLITMDWRAKISGFRLAKPLISIEEKGETNWNESVIVGRKGYLAPEYLSYGQASLKLDVYAFGVVLLELLSAKEAIFEGCFLKGSLGFWANGGIEDSSGCLEKFKAFMDPVLQGDYPLGDAMCLALLAKGCVEEDPIHRPTMNDVLKTLSRIV